MTRDHNTPVNAVIIVAGGRGSRAGAGLPKQYRDIFIRATHNQGQETGEKQGRAPQYFGGTKPVLAHTLQRFLHHLDIDHVQVVIHGDDADRYAAALTHLTHDSDKIALAQKLLPAVQGGETRQSSVYAGLNALSQMQSVPEFVLVHDAARPYVSDHLIHQLCAGMQHGNQDGIIPTRPLTDTIKYVSGSQVEKTLPRAQLAAAQTPQIFKFSSLLAAHQSAHHVAHQVDNEAAASSATSVSAEATDDAALMETHGARITTIDGEKENIKMTYEEDFMMHKPLYTPRTGFGFDVHRLTQGTQGLHLCGIHIEGPLELVGHSDADVGLHALTDALLGLIAHDDIGAHFPPSDDAHRGRDSAEFVTFACQKLEEHQAILTHIDITLICEQPKVGPLRQAMRERLSQLLHLPLAQISVKATTTEGLGFTGRGEGIAAQVVATAMIAAQ